MPNDEKRRRLTTMDVSDHSVRPLGNVVTTGGSRRGRRGAGLQGTFSGNPTLNLLQRIGADLRSSTWMDRANCLDEDPEIFFPDHGGLNSEARRVCGACPVREECGNYGRHEEHGTWGGRSNQSRRKQGEFQKALCAGDCGQRLANNTNLAWCAECDPDPIRKRRRISKILRERARRAGSKSTVTARPDPIEATVAGIIRGIKALGDNATRPKLYARLAANRRPSFEQAMLQLEERITEKDGVISLDD